MAKFKDFGGSQDAGSEPISFRLYDQEFICTPAVQGRVLLSIVSDSGSEDPAVIAGVTDKFFGYVLVDESLERFNALTTDKDTVVTVESLGEIVAWLVEQYSDRPNQQPEA
jgi:hypothetical protein